LCFLGFYFDFEVVFARGSFLFLCFNNQFNGVVLGFCWIESDCGFGSSFFFGGFLGIFLKVESFGELELKEGTLLDTRLKFESKFVPKWLVWNWVLKLMHFSVRVKPGIYLYPYPFYALLIYIYFFGYLLYFPLKCDFFCSSVCDCEV